MRESYHEELDDITKLVVQMAKAAAVAIDQATTALLNADLAVAEQVLAADTNIDTLRNQIEVRCFDLIAQQAPVATDLRVLISTIHLSADLERMGDLAHHIARIARLRYPEPAVPAPVQDVFRQAGEVAQSLVGKVLDVVDGRDVELAQAIEAEDDSMDALRRKLFTMTLSSNWTHGTEAAVDVTLLGRYYERYADHAVAVARHVMFIVTGERIA